MPTLIIAAEAYILIFAGIFGTLFGCGIFLGIVVFLRLTYCPRIRGRGATIKQIIKLRQAKFSAVADQIDPEDAK